MSELAHNAMHRSDATRPGGPSPTGAMLAQIGVVCLWLLPFLWFAALSFKSQTQILSSSSLWHWEPTLDNYRDILKLNAGGDAPALLNVPPGNFTDYFLNSTIVSVGAVVTSIVFGAPAAYSFARYRFLGAQPLFASLLLMRLLPPIAVLIPMYVLFREEHLLGTYTAMILADVTFSLPLVAWILRGFFEELPSELFEAATIDGCSRFGTFWRIALPLSRPGLVAAAIISFIISWNDFLFAAVLSQQSTQTLPVMIAGYNSETGIQWGALSAVSVLSIIPAAIFTFFAQRHLLTGLAAGAVKG